MAGYLSCVRSSAPGRVATVLGIMVLASVVTERLSPLTALAETAPLPSTRSASESTPQQTEEHPLFAESREAWRAMMSRVPLPRTGCFSASYPRVEWREVPCAPASTLPNAPLSGTVGPVGNGNDFSAPAFSILSATGSFDSISPLTSETGNVAGQTPPVAVANAFTLQINVKPFNTNACQGSAPPRGTVCQGWQQFIFSNTQCGGGPCIFIEYWLQNYGPNCPSGPWQQTAQPPNSCYFNGSGPSPPVQTIANLAQPGFSLAAQANANGLDTIIIATSNGGLQAAGNDSVLGLAGNWKSAEFNIFGDCCLSQAIFTPGSALVVRTALSDFTSNAPQCAQTGFTGETNNLNLLTNNPCASSGGTSPAIVFTENLGPIVTSVTPSSGSNQGDTPVTIQGTTFSTAPGGSAIDFGGESASGIACASPTPPNAQCATESPFYGDGTATVDVQVTAFNLTSPPIRPADQFTYLAGPQCGATLTCAAGNFSNFPYLTVQCPSGVSFQSNGACYSLSPTTIVCGTTEQVEPPLIACDPPTSGGSCTYFSLFQVVNSYCGLPPPPPPPPPPGGNCCTACIQAGGICTRNPDGTCSKCQ
jgi:IPT/TIG domain